MDTRLLSEQGRDQIAEDLLRNGMIVDTVEQIIKTEKVNTLDFVSEVDKRNTTYEAVKEEIANDPALAAALQNPDLTPDQKEAMLNQITGAVMVKLGYDAEDFNTNLIDSDATGHGGDQVAGYYDPENNEAYINDRYNNSSDALVETSGHELSHALDDIDGIETDEEYARNDGKNLAKYTDLALDINGHDDGLAATNSHNGNETSELIKKNNDSFESLDKTQGHDYLVSEQMADAVKEYDACTTAECQDAVLTKYIEKGSENLAWMVGNCRPGNDQNPACKGEIADQRQAIEDYKVGEFDFYENEDTRLALDTFHKYNLSEQGIAGQLATGVTAEAIADSLGLEGERRAEMIEASIIIAAAILGSKIAKKPTEDGTSTDQSVKEKGKESGSIKGNSEGLNQPVKEGVPNSSGRSFTPATETPPKPSPTV